MSVGGEDAERGWDFEFVDYEPGSEVDVVVIKSAPKLDGKKWCTRDALLGWTTHQVMVPGAEAEAEAPGPFTSSVVVPELGEELLERAVLFVQYFPLDELARFRQRLVVDTGVAVRRDLDLEPLRLHTAVQITAAGFGDHHGLVVGLPREEGRGRNIYSVMYWAGNSGAAMVQPYHRRDLAALVRPHEQPSISIR